MKVQRKTPRIVVKPRLIEQVPATRTSISAARRFVILWRFAVARGKTSRRTTLSDASAVAQRLPQKLKG